MRSTVVNMPLTFDNKKEYLNKLTELIDTEGEIERIKIESIAEQGISFRFLERLSIFCKLEMKIRKDLSKFVSNHTILQVNIPIMNPAPGALQSYEGIGVVKMTKLKPRDPMMYVTL